MEERERVLVAYAPGRVPELLVLVSKYIEKGDIFLSVVFNNMHFSPLVA